MSNLIAQTLARTVDFFNGEPAATSLLGKIDDRTRYVAERDSDTVTLKVFMRPEGHQGAGFPLDHILAVALKPSHDSLGVIAGLEYFLFSGELYRARMANPLDVNGYRMGARWQAPAHLADEFFKMAQDA